MNATLLYRIAAFVFVATACGHTYSILSPPSPSPDARAAYDSMNNVRVQGGGRSFNYGRVYRGLGLMGTASLLFWALLAWHLGDLARSGADGSSLGWALFALQVAVVVLSFRYFHVPARVLSGLAAVLVGFAAWLA